MKEKKELLKNATFMRYLQALIVEVVENGVFIHEEDTFLALSDRGVLWREFKKGISRLHDRTIFVTCNTAGSFFTLFGTLEGELQRIDFDSISEIKEIYKQTKKRR
jgi:hypothetical protein